MGAINNFLYGYWKMSAMRFQQGDGSWENETVYGGSSIITSGGLINTFTRAEISFGYSGTFTINGDELVIRPIVCSIPEIEGKTIYRTVKKVTPEMLILGMTDDATGRKYEIEFRILTRSLT